MNTEKYHEMEELEKTHWWFIHRQKILKFILKKFLPDLCLDAKIVDIGCGTGGNVQLLSQLFEDVAGIDNNDFAIQYCQEKNLRNIIKGELPELDFIKNNSVDLFLLFDVLEHVENDKKALEVLKEKLKEKGHLLLTVPAFSFLWSKHDEEFHHKRRYNMRQVKNLLKQLDFKIVKSSYLYFFFFPLVLFMRIIKKINKKYADMDDFKLNNKLLNKILIKLLEVEEFLLNFLNFPFGSSILILAKKAEGI